jgi:glycosyltransferase involved in cell wall biosynthesis
MRVLHVIWSLDPKGGGPVEALKSIAKSYVEAGHEIEVLTLDAPDSPHLKDFPHPVYAVGPGVGWYKYTPRLVPCLKKIHSRYDVVVVNGIWQYSSYGVWRALRGTDTPYAVFTHGMLDPWFKKNYPLKHVKKWLYWPWAEYRVLRDARAVLFTCEEERRLARKSFWLYRCHEEVVGYGTTPPVSTGAAANREALYERFPQLRDKSVLLYLGRLHEKKACDLVLKAYAHMRQQGMAPEHLFMAGPGSEDYVHEMKALSTSLGLERAGSITWGGHLNGTEKWAALDIAEAFMLPSHQENFGVAVAEALARGVPVLISDKVNIHWEVASDGAGLVESDTLEGAENLLRRWSMLPRSKRERMRDDAHRCFDTRFDIHRTVQRMLDLFKARSPETASPTKFSNEPCTQRSV